MMVDSDVDYEEDQEELSDDEVTEKSEQSRNKLRYLVMFSV